MYIFLRRTILFLNIFFSSHLNRKFDFQCLWSGSKIEFSTLEKKVTDQCKWRCLSVHSPLDPIGPSPGLPFNHSRHLKSNFDLRCNEKLYAQLGARQQFHECDICPRFARAANFTLVKLSPFAPCCAIYYCMSQSLSEKFNFWFLITFFTFKTKTVHFIKKWSK